MDFLNQCIDEIALEGLDGITLESLWLRLESRVPTFPLKLDAKCKAYLWRLVSCHKDVLIYELPKPRPTVVLVDRFKNTDPSTGIFLEQESQQEDIYPLQIISDGNIQGSCTTYHKRKEIANVVRSKNNQCLLSLEETMDKWGNKLVLVGTQEVRTQALYGPEVDPSLVLPEKLYCILERIGRTRRQGELTHGKQSITIFKEPSKTIFYLRKVLVRHNLITVQPFNQKLLNGINSTGKCLHLKRFFVEYKPVYLGLLENLTHRLADKPHQREALTVVRTEMGMREQSFKKLYQFGHKYVKTDVIPYKNMYPESTKEEFMVKQGTKERFVRVLALKKLYKYSSDMGAEDEEDVGSDDDGDKSTECDGVYDRVVELPLLHQAYKFARSKGEEGASQTDFSIAFRASRLDGRLMARNLDRLGMVKTILQDQGKQRVHMFVAKEFLAGSTLHKKLQEEKAKIVQLTLPKAEIASVEGETASASSPRHSRSTTPVLDASTTSEHDLDLSALEESVPLIDTINTSEKYHFRKKGAHVTYRLLKRANYILKAVQEAKLVDNIFQIQKKIIEDEMAEGYTSRCDKKSLLRLIERLARDGQIKSIKTLIKFGNEEKQLHFLCDPSISASDQIVTSAIEAAKLRHIAVSKELTNEIKKGQKLNEPNLVPSDPKLTNYGLLKSQLTLEDMQHDPDAGKRYGYKPRMIRLQLIHQLLFYLVYVYDMEAAAQVAADVPEVPAPKPGEEEVPAISPALSEQKVYCDEISWKRFIPPLPKHRDYEEGWCLIGDVLLRLPVSIFCQIIRVNFKIAGLEELLADDVKKYLTVSQLPSNIRQQLMIERKYIFAFYSSCISLCLMGLLTFGKREWKQKEQIFIHVNRRSTLIDTTDTEESFENRPVEEFEFKDNSDLENYWFRLQWICLNTPIDAIVIKADPAGVNHSTTNKIERFTPYLEGKLPTETKDDGSLPGNKLGAAGLDSTFFGHLRRNWSATNGNLKAETLITEGKRKLMEEGKNVVKKPRKKRHESVEKTSILTSEDSGSVKTFGLFQMDKGLLTTGTTRGPFKKGPVEKHKKTIKTKKVFMEGGKAPKGGKGVKRKITEPQQSVAEPVPPKRKRQGDGKPTRKNEYDSIDKAALRRMTKERVMWTPQEDSLLLLCEVASSILGGLRRDFLVPFTTVRNLMHQNFSTSLDKTSKACQRRIRYILKRPETVANVTMYKGEALQDKEMVEKYLTGKKYTRQGKNTDTLNEVFIELVNCLREKFKNFDEQGAQLLPDTLEAVYKRYTLSRPAIAKKSEHKEVKVERDIQFSVLHNVIHSAMVIQDKSGHASELYHVFSQYPDELLQAVFNQMRSDGIVTKIKAYAANRDTNKRTMPGPSVAIGSYQMAQRYTYKWFSRYKKSIFLQAYSLLDMVGSPGMRSTESKRINVRESDPKPKIDEPQEKKGQDEQRSKPKHDVGEAGDSVGRPGHTIDTSYGDSNGTQLVDLKDEGVYAALLVSLMVQRKALLEIHVPDQVIVVESQYMSKQKTHSQKKKYADMEKELHLGTASDEEEEALIEEAEKARASATSYHDAPTLREIDIENKKSTSRTSLVLFRSQYANGPISVRMLAPQDHIVINSCYVKLKLLDMFSRANSPSPDDIYKAVYDGRLYHREWNQKQFWIHPKTCQRMLSRIRKLEPAEIDFNAFFTACKVKWGFSRKTIERIQNLFKDIEEHAYLGLKEVEIAGKVKLALWLSPDKRPGLRRAITTSDQSEL